MVHYCSLVALLELFAKEIKHGNLSSGQMYNMETRQRKIHSRDGSQSVVDHGGENRPDARILEATKDDPAAVKKDDYSSHTAEDAVVVAAVRGGSLLMLLALIQVCYTAA